MDPANLKRIALFGVLFITPYIYYFTIRKNLIKIERKIDRKIINVSEEELNSALYNKLNTQKDKENDD